jgi:CheY-like chemotaxis protein
LAQQPRTNFVRLGLFASTFARKLGVATVLIVEDQAQVLVLAEAFLEEQGHRTLSATTPNEALAILTGAEAVDALLVDVILNGDTQAGIELARRAVELKPGLKVVYSTGLTLTDNMKAFLVPGSVILEKPYTVDQLLTSLSAHFGRGPQPHV